MPNAARYVCAYSIVGEVGKHLAIDGQDRTLADETDKETVGIHDWKGPGMCPVEDANHNIHRVVDGKQGLGLSHELRDGKAPVQLRAEDEVADVIQIDNPDELHLLVDDREDVVLAVADLRSHVAQAHVRVEELVVMLYDAIHTHEGKDGLVRVVGEQLASLCQAHSIDAVGLEALYGEVGTYRHYHQRHEEGIAARQFGDEENARQRSMHHAAHQAAHAQHGEVSLWNVDAQDVVSIPKPTEDESADTPQEKAGREDTATTAAAVGCRRSKNLEDNYQEKVDEQVIAAVEKRAVHRSIPVGLPLAVEQESDEVVAFAIERREKVDEQAQHEGSKRELLVSSIQPSEDAFQQVHRPRKVECHQSADNSEGDIGRDAVDSKGILQVELEDGICARDSKRQPGSRDAGNKQRQEAGHRKVNHQDLKHEDKSRDWCLEDACNGSCGSTTHEQHHVFVAQAAELSEATADGTTGKDDWSLSPDTSAKTNRDG